MTIIAPNTAQWVAARVGVLTASRMADAMPGKDGKPKAAGQTLAYKLLAERRTGRAEETFVSAAMQWGLDHEAEAIDAYECKTGRLCQTAGLVMHPTIAGFGATPDRFVIGGGLVEVKCPTTPTHLRYMLEGVLPDEYAAQVWAQLACTGELWCDFVSYDPRVTRGAEQLFVVRVERNDAEIEKVERAAEVFLLHVAKLEATLELRN